MMSESISKWKQFNHTLTSHFGNVVTIDGQTMGSYGG
jgi:hypothetical protein